MFRIARVKAHDRVIPTDRKISTYIGWNIPNGKIGRRVFITTATSQKVADKKVRKMVKNCIVIVRLFDDQILLDLFTTKVLTVEHVK